MNSIKHRFTLDMHSAQSQISLPALLGDTGRSWHINFSDGGIPYFIETGCLAKISIVRPTGTHIEEFCEIVGNSTAVYHFAQNENTCAVEGIHECDVTLYGLEGESIASARFSMIVSERVIRSDDINVTDEDRSVVEAMVTAEAQRQAAETLRVAAEAERVANEQRRQEASGTILAKAEEVAVLRERAANASDLAVEASTVAIASADTATTNAQMASGSASEAEQSAREAKASEEIAKSIAFDSVNMDARISRTDKLITNLVQGVTTIPVETDDSVAYIKDVPTNALPYAEISKVGGMSYKDEATNTLKDSKVTEIKILGANLTTAQTVYSEARSYAEMVVDGRNCVRMTSGAKHQISPFPFKVNTQYTVSFDSKCEDFGGASGPNCVFAFYYSDGTQDILYAPRIDTDWTHYTFTSAVGKTVEQIGVHAAQYLIYNYIDIDTFMLNEGATALPYVPYAKHTLPIPTEIQSLDGYGEGVNADCYNYIDFKKKQFVKRVKRVDMGTLIWTYDSEYSRHRAAAISDAKVGVRKAQCLMAMYTAYSNSEPINSITDKAVYMSNGDLYIHDSSYPDANSFQAAMSGVILYYELATPEVTDISHILSDDNMIEVEGGGTITFENEGKFAVPSSITYMLKGAK